jgi:hypothetical protein
VVRAAKNLASSKRIKSLVHQLFDFEQACCSMLTGFCFSSLNRPAAETLSFELGQAPQKEKAFRKFAKEKLADNLQACPERSSIDNPSFDIDDILKQCDNHMMYLYVLGTSVSSVQGPDDLDLSLPR